MVDYAQLDFMMGFSPKVDQAYRCFIHLQRVLVIIVFVIINISVKHKFYFLVNDVNTLEANSLFRGPAHAPLRISCDRFDTSISVTHNFEVNISMLVVKWSCTDSRKCNSVNAFLSNCKFSFSLKLFNLLLLLVYFLGRAWLLLWRG